jgi:EAL and modified HD-GYP domain-containing signal transduction protein
MPVNQLLSYNDECIILTDKRDIMSGSFINNVPIVARQAIFDKDLNVYAYELLFRSNNKQIISGVIDSFGDEATSRVINYTFMELGIERVIGNHLAFVNLTRKFILTDDPLPFAQDRVVLEILEDIVPDAELIAATQKLVDQGYLIALDDFIFEESLRPLVQLAAIIKIDLLAFSEQVLIEQVTLLKQENVKLLAEKVETQEQYQLCKKLGFDYFQGYFFSRPTIIEGQAIPDSQLNLLSIITKLQNQNVEIDDIEQLISQDVGLTYKLLRLLNSAAIGLPRKIESIKQGLILLGLKAIRTWTTLIALNNMKFTPPELMANTLIRAKMCEQLASHYNCSAEAGFLVGLFSTIDAMLSYPMDELLKALPLNDDIKQALSGSMGTLGELLNVVIQYEHGLWDEVNTELVSLEQLGQYYINATEWTIQTQSNL